MSVKPIRINVIDKPEKTLKILQPQPEVKQQQNFTTQLEVFQSSMKYCLISAQCLGLFPVVNITGKDPQKMKYKMFSKVYLLCYIILFTGTLITLIACLRLAVSALSIRSIKNIVFFAMVLTTNITFINISSNWHRLMELVNKSKLDEYTNTSVIFKCKFTTISMLTLGFIEHLISKTFSIIMLNCKEDNTQQNPYDRYLHVTYDYVFGLNPPHAIVVGIFVQIFHLVSAFIWSHSHLFVICISLYLTSILKQLNKKIISCDGKELPVFYWRTLREDYTQVAQLVHSFDEIINSVMFIVAASDLFFLCCQAFALIETFVTNFSLPICTNNSLGTLPGFLFASYLTISVVFYIIRFYTVLIVASKIHTESLVAAPILYNVSSSSYCVEVQRFIEKVNGDTVALTGLKFFYATRGMILSVLGPIVTYELVLLQFTV